MVITLRPGVCFFLSFCSFVYRADFHSIPKNCIFIICDENRGRKNIQSNRISSGFCIISKTIEARKNAVFLYVIIFLRDIVMAYVQQQCNTADTTLERDFFFCSSVDLMKMLRFLFGVFSLLIFGIYLFEFSSGQSFC